MQTTATDTAALRAFNRIYTVRLGLLNARLDQSPFSLTEARILYELAHREAPAAADLARDLDLDRAQLSRTLKRFASRGLVTTSDAAKGGRRRPIRLTRAGRDAFTALDRNTQQAIGALLGSLRPGQRDKLVSAARTITRVFDDASTTDAVLRDLKPGDLGWITHRQAILYTEEYGWNRDYEALVSRILADFVDSFDASHDAAWVAEIDGLPVGSVFLVRSGKPNVGKLRLLYVEPSARGQGVGAALVAACIARARSVGDHTLELWTNSVLVSARRIYERAGFKLVEENPHRSFGANLVGQIWSLDLRPAEGEARPPKKSDG